MIRETAGGIATFCVLRHQKSSFLGGAVVFPGGKVDAADLSDTWAERSTAPHPRAELMASASAPARALGVAACRELLEEGGIVPVAGALGADDLAVLRAEISAAPAAAAPTSEGALIQALARRGLRLDLAALVPWARWVTPTAESRRFDARFFLLELPAGQEGRHDEHETTMSFWARPADVLDRYARGEVFLAPPTTRTLELLADARDVAQARAIAEEQSLLPICPAFVPDDPPFLALPGDPAHEVRERRVSGPTRFVLRDGRFIGEDAPAEATAAEHTASRRAVATGDHGEG